MKEQYEALCTGEDCFKVVKESDIERNRMGDIYERSKKCWDCRTDVDRRMIRQWRKKQRGKLPTATPLHHA